MPLLPLRMSVELARRITVRLKYAALLYALSGLLLATPIAGCVHNSPPPSLQRELEAVFATVPRYPDSQEVERRFLYEEQTHSLMVVFSVPSYRISDPQFRKALEDAGWKFIRVNGELAMDVFGRDTWLLALRPGPRKSQFYMEVFRKPGTE